MRKQQKSERPDEPFDDAPPVLVPEENLNTEEVVIDNELQQQDMYDDGAYALGDQYFVDNGVLYQKPTGHYAPPSTAKSGGGYSQQQQNQQQQSLEFNFLDANNICCGLCGEIVPYETLTTHHLPKFHPEVVGGDGYVDLEEIPYEAWLNEKMQVDSKAGILPSLLGAGQGPSSVGSRYVDASRPMRSTRTLRRISQIRVNIHEMTLSELDIALNKKMVEKMGRKVPVNLVDKQHARCGICGSVVSLNKKFEIIHLVRHFNAWHPSAHKCAGTWISKNKDNLPSLEGTGKPLSTQDFAVIDTSLNAAESLQCIWCGMFMDGRALAMHFHEVHPEEIEVPKCNLCLQEIVINARFTEKYGEDFSITLPDEHHLRCGKFETRHTSEAAMDKAIAKQITNALDYSDDEGGPSGEGDKSGKGCEAFSNSRMTFGRRSKPKRQFIMPALRQAVPVNSLYVEQVADCHWRCRLCRSDILAAVISAGAIRHYRHYHPNQLQSMQFELCKARLERVSDGCMEFLNVDTIECLICNMTFPLHRPFNMCRAIRHLKAKHPEKMPEYNGGHEVMEVSKIRKQKFDEVAPDQPTGADEGEEMEEGVMYTRELIDSSEIEALHQQYNVDFDKVYEITGKNIAQRIYVLTAESEEMTVESVQQIVSQVDGAVMEDSGPIVVQYSKAEMEEAMQEQQQLQPQHHDETGDSRLDEYGDVRKDNDNLAAGSRITADGVIVNQPLGAAGIVYKTETIIEEEGEDDGSARQADETAPDDNKLFL